MKKRNIKNEKWAPILKIKSTINLTAVSFVVLNTK